ncbi:MAG: PaaX family transcriptional regulator C-terminal domain-containing protein [Betaproteobacteria bacterium]
MRVANSVSDPGPRAADDDPVVGRWIAATIAADPPRARSLIVTVWGDAIAPHSGTLWLRELIGLMAALGVAERSVRTSVYRLAADGWLRGEAQGRESRYRLTPAGAKQFANAYRRIYFPHDDEWNGKWQVVIAPPETLSARERVALRNAFTWTGFGTLAPGLYIRPRGAHGEAIPAPIPVRRRLTVLDARDDAASGAASLTASVAQAWDLRGLAANWRAYLGRFGRAIDHFRDGGRRNPSPRQCFVARTLLIHAFRRVLLRDPLLPAALLPLDWPGTAAYTLTRDFYRLVYRPADEYLAAMLGADFSAASSDFARRFGGLD